MAASAELSLALLQGGSVLVGSVMMRNYCARSLTADMVPAVLRNRIRFCDRLAPLMLVLGLAIVATGLFLRVTPS